VDTQSFAYPHIKDGASQIFTKVMTRGGGADLSGGYWNLKRKDMGNHAFFRDN